MYVLTRARQIMGGLLFKASLPPVRRLLRARWETDADTPLVGLAGFGSLRRLSPISRDWGDDRDGPVDRYYITDFLGRNRQDSASCGNHWCWSLTALSTCKLFEEQFPPERVTIETHGNVPAAAPFLHGLGQGELTKREIDHHDPDYEMLIVLRAQKEPAA